MPDATSPAAIRPARESIADLLARISPGPVLYGFPSGHTAGRDDAAVRRARARRDGGRRRALVIEEAAVRRSEDCKHERIHLIGVCGTAMATLAAMLKQRGYDVRGSDQNVYPPMSDFLARSRASRRCSGYSAEHITADLDLVVVGNAISRGNPELEEVLDRKIRYCSLPEAMRDQFLWGARSIVIAGTHGKTTTTSLTGWLLTHGGADPSVLVGGIADNFETASYRIGGGRDFVIEGDEYDSAFFDKTAKFLKYLPDIAVINNIEFDHADIYPDLDAGAAGVPAVRRTWCRATGCCCSAPTARTRWRSAGSARCRGRDVRRSRRRATGRRTICSVAAASTRFSVRAAGSADRRRSRCRCSARTTCATRWRRSRSAPPSGMRHRDDGRRAAGVRAASSGGSSSRARPTASRSTTTSRIIRPRSPRRSRACGRRIPIARIWAIFEPRSATSCRRDIPGGFRARVRAAPTKSCLPPVFRSTLPETERLSAGSAGQRPAGGGRRTRATSPTTAEIVRTVASEQRTGDLVVIMSNGGFDDIHQKLLSALEARTSH